MNSILPKLANAAWAVVLVSALGACTAGLDRKLDGTNESTFESSLAAIRKSATAEESMKLDDALRALAVTDVSIGYEGGIVGALRKISTRTPEQLSEPLMPLVNGKTGREVIAAGQKRIRDEATKQMAALDKELLELKRLSAEKATTQAALAPIEILDATLRFNSVGPEKMSVMDFKVKNGTDTGLTYLYMRGTVTEAASGKVLVSEDIKYKLSDEPLLPGVTKPLRLPHGRGKWTAPEVWGKDNLGFAIELVNAENLQGQKLAAAFTHRDGERMALLEQNKVALAQMLADK